MVFGQFLISITGDTKVSVCYFYISLSSRKMRTLSNIISVPTATLQVLIFCSRKKLASFRLFLYLKDTCNLRSATLVMLLVLTGLLMTLDYRYPWGTITGDTKVSVCYFYISLSSRKMRTLSNIISVPTATLQVLIFCSRKKLASFRLFLYLKDTCNLRSATLVMLLVLTGLLMTLCRF